MEQKCIIILFFLLFIIILILRKKYSRIKRDFQELKRKTELENQKRDSYKGSKDDISLDIENNPANYYCLKNSCMNPNESRVFYYLNCILDEFFKEKRREDFIVFPQVGLYAFISIGSEVEKNYMAKDIALQRLAKNVDFIICQRYKKDSYYLYRPILLVEIDGKSHRSTTPFGEKSLLKQQKTDALKDNISSALGLPLFRYKHDSSIMRDDRYKIKDELYRYFQQMNIL
ncbi:MAG: DUF2726 domain-containing protein [Bacillus sp. (in: Bacteria)]|nr:DUF2726 domain-containing protein [Bacillus sp. (in: firmicutes)]MCM1424979.1 DUF2726 domain-containing protein [Eubacterium sp.]